MSDLDNDFIDREKQLPADVRTLPPDVANYEAAGLAMRAAPAGEPPDDYNVRSVYDSRPLNGFDFNITDSAPFVSSNLEILTFDVPQGYVCVLRHITYFVTNPPAINSLQDVLGTLRRANADVAYNIDIPIGAARELDCFLIADEFEEVGFKVTSTGVYQDASNIVAHFYGQFLLKTNIPAPFEIANRAGEGSISTIQQLAIGSPKRFDKAPTPSEWRAMSEDQRIRYNEEMAKRRANRGAA